MRGRRIRSAVPVPRLLALPTMHAGSPTTPAPDDPCPVPPDKPLPGECCESGCPICVYDLYAEALEEYRQALLAWKQRHPDLPGA